MANGQSLIDFYKSFGGTQRVSPIERENLIVEEKQNELTPMTPPVVPPLVSDLSTMGPPEPTGLLTEKEQEEIAKDPIALAKFSRAGNLFASFGGFQEPTQQELLQATPERLDAINKQKLAARNKGIGEMLLMLSDALGGRDVAMRALERQKLKQPTPIKATEAIKQEELAVLQKLKRLETTLKEGETIDDLLGKLTRFEKIVYDNFIERPKSQSFIEDFLSGAFDNNTSQQGPIDLGEISE